MEITTQLCQEQWRYSDREVLKAYGVEKQANGVRVRTESTILAVLPDQIGGVEATVERTLVEVGIVQISCPQQGVGG